MRRLAALALFLVVPRVGAAEPEFNGRPLSGWVEMLKADPQPRKRRAAVVALGQLAAGTADARAVALVALGKALRADADAKVREIAAKVIAQQDPETAGALVTDLSASARQEREPAVRLAAIEALARFGKLAAPGVGALTEALADADDGVKAAAADALGRVGPEAAPAAAKLVPLADSPDAKVRRAALFALGRVAPPDKSAAAKPLVAALTSTDAQLRREALTSLGLLGDTTAPTLLGVGKLLASPNGPERAAAAETLGRFGSAAGVLRDDLAKLARTDADAAVRLQAVRAVRRVGGDPVALYGERLPVDAAFEVRVAILEELGALGPAAKPALAAMRAARGDAAPQVREAATAAVKRVEKP